jgi:hypothetical protein
MCLHRKWLFPDPDIADDCSNILSIIAALITPFQLPPITGAWGDQTGGSNSVLCTQYDFILSCSCMLCCICENITLHTQSGSATALVVSIAGQLLPLAHSCLVLLGSHQQTDLMHTLCVQLHATLMQLQVQEVGVSELMQPTEAWVELLEPLQYSPHTGLALATAMLIDYWC